MHVGVIAPNWGAEVGGGYTLENDLFEAVFAEAPTSQHQFTALVDSSSQSSQVRHPALEIGGARQPFKELVQRGKQAMRAAVEKMRIKPAFRKGYRAVRATGESLGFINRNGSAAPFYELLERAAGRLDAIVAKCGIEFVVSLNPMKYCTRQPYLIPVWDLEHRKQPFFPEVRGAEWQSRQTHYHKALGRAAFVVTGTQAGAAEVERFFAVNPKRIRVVPFPTPGFALESVSEDSEDRLPQIPAGVPFLFYPAQFWAHKNHVTALKVLKELRERHQVDMNLVLVGSDQGNLAHVKEWARRLSLESTVILPGFVSRPQLRWLYRHALALFYPTFFGPDNLPPLEAFALGCPVIGSAIDGASEQLGDAALLCDPVDVAGFASAAVTLLKDADYRAQLIERGKIRAAHWTRRDAARSLIALLDEFAPVRDNWGT